MLIPNLDHALHAVLLFGGLAVYLILVFIVCVVWYFWPRRRRRLARGPRRAARQPTAWTYRDAVLDPTPERGPPRARLRADMAGFAALPWIWLALYLGAFSVCLYGTELRRESTWALVVGIGGPVVLAAATALVLLARRELREREGPRPLRWAPRAVVAGGVLPVAFGVPLVVGLPTAEPGAWTALTIAGLALAGAGVVLAALVGAACRRVSVGAR
jgi:hypothetical protein